MSLIVTAHLVRSHAGFVYPSSYGHDRYRLESPDEARYWEQLPSDNWEPYPGLPEGVGILSVSTVLQIPRLRSASLVLRAFTTADAALVVEAGADPMIPLITTVPAAPADAAAVLAFIERQHDRARSGQGYSFVIADAVNDDGLGQIELWPHAHGRASIGYWIAASARRRGFATEALRMVSQWGLTLPRLHRLELYVEPWNEGSWRAAERVGYTREGLLRSWESVGGERRDMYMYSLLPTDPAAE